MKKRKSSNNIFSVKFCEPDHLRWSYSERRQPSGDFDHVNVMPFGGLLKIMG